MARLNVNPTRMELTKLKRRLKVARRGHKLLKDKRDELMKQFLEKIRIVVDLRAKVEEMLTAAHKNFLLARAQMSSEIMGEALMFPARTAEIEVGSRNIMSVEAPTLRIRITGDRDEASFPYGFASTSAGLDESIMALSNALPFMLELAEAEKTSQLLSQEIEKTRRRVNALEYVMIPRLEETIKYIAMKLEENERGNITRLMKVKSMMIEQARKEHLAQG
jgi:V/A-type H+-transporting ATPase subunit D